jgi:hypothetical protein
MNKDEFWQRFFLTYGKDISKVVLAFFVMITTGIVSIVVICAIYRSPSEAVPKIITAYLDKGKIAGWFVAIVVTIFSSLYIWLFMGLTNREMKRMAEERDWLQKQLGIELQHSRSQQ